MNRHEEWLELSAYVDGALDTEERARLEAHLFRCKNCQAELEALRRVKQRLASSPRRSLPPDLLIELEECGEKQTARRWAWPGILKQTIQGHWLSAGTAAVMILVAGLWLGLHHPEDELPIEILAAAHSRYSAEGLIPGDMVASNFSAELAQLHHNEN